MTSVFAQGVNIFAEELNPPPFSGIGEIISYILPNLYILAGIILFLLLIGGGFVFILNAGKGQKEGMAQAQKAISTALIGFIIIIGSYWLIQIISFITGVEILTPPAIFG